MGLQLHGLSDGINWSEQAIEPLLELQVKERIKPKTDAKEANQQEINALGVLASKLQTLDGITGELKDSNLYFSRTSTLATEDSTVLTSSVSTKADLGKFTFDITQLATASQLNGDVDVGGAVHTVDVTWNGAEEGPLMSDVNTLADITAGYITINAQRVTIATTDTLKTVLAAINTATSGDIEANYNTTTDKITLTSVGSNDIVVGSAGDTSNFFKAAKLFSGATGVFTVSSLDTIGSVGLDDSIANSNVSSIASVSASGSFMINGETIAFDKADDSIRTIMNRVESSDAGVRLYYDEATDKFFLENKSTGSLGVSVADTSGGLLAAMGLVGGSSSTTLGSVATFTVNGGNTITSNSNILTEDVHGVGGLSVTAKEVNSETITVETEKGQVEAKLKDFVEKYNDVISYINDNAKIRYIKGANGKQIAVKGILSSNQVSELKRDLRAKVFASYGDSNDKVKRLMDLGVEDKKGIEGKLEFTSATKLTQALADNAEQVSHVFSDSTSGFGVSMEGLILDYDEGSTGSGQGNMGFIQVLQKSLEDRNKRLDNSIEREEKRLADEREKLEEKFRLMETFKLKSKSDSSALMRLIGE